MFVYNPVIAQKYKLLGNETPDGYFPMHPRINSQCVRMVPNTILIEENCEQRFCVAWSFASFLRSLGRKGFPNR
jgi:hypothetical protein